MHHEKPVITRIRDRINARGSGQPYCIFHVDVVTLLSDSPITRKRFYRTGSAVPGFHCMQCENNMRGNPCSGVRGCQRASTVMYTGGKDMKNVNVRKLALAGILVAVGIVCSPLSIPVGASKCAPIQHFINILGGVFLGPGL